MIIDFWDEDTLTEKFMDLYNLTSAQICNMIKRIKFHGDNDFIFVFCKESGIKLDQVDVTKGLIFNGKIVSTSIDKLDSIKQMGLVPVDILLEYDSPIRRHLSKYDLQINPSKHELIYKGNKYFIPEYSNELSCFESCKWCALGNEKCQYTSSRYQKDMFCSYLISIAPLATKLYSDHAEIEMFLSETYDEMLKYSTVSKYPEIFQTITYFVRDFFNDNLLISSDWMTEKQRTYIISAPVSYEDMSYRNGYIDASNGLDAEEVYSNYKDYCGSTYDFIEEIPNCFWDNIWLISVCLNMISNYPNGMECLSLCAGIKHEITIPYSKLEIELVE